MKKLTVILAALVMGFVMVSCDNTPKKEVITKAVDEFFSTAEQELASISTGEEFMTHFYEFEEKKNDFIQELFADYIDAEGNIKGISNEDMEEIQNFMYDRASAYNKVEAAKAAEFMEPAIANYEAAINALYEAVATGQSTEGLVDQFEAAENELAAYADYDNVLPELQERAQAAEARLDEVIAAMSAE